MKSKKRRRRKRRKERKGERDLCRERRRSKELWCKEKRLNKVWDEIVISFKLVAIWQSKREVKTHILLNNRVERGTRDQAPPRRAHPMNIDAQRVSHLLTRERWEREEEKASVATNLIHFPPFDCHYLSSKIHPFRRQGEIEGEFRVRGGRERRERRAEKEKSDEIRVESPNRVRMISESLWRVWVSRESYSRLFEREKRQRK